LGWSYIFNGIAYFSNLGMVRINKKSVNNTGMLALFNGVNNK